MHLRKHKCQQHRPLASVVSKAHRKGSPQKSKSGQRLKTWMSNEMFYPNENTSSRLKESTETNYGIFNFLNR